MKITSELFKNELWPLLKEPFDPDELYFRPQSYVDNKECQILTYCDKRSATEKLDNVLGPENWSLDIDVSNSAFKMYIKEKLDWNTKEVKTPASIQDGYKIYAIAKVGVLIDGEWIYKSSTGVSESDDSNSITTAEAQAVKRTISLWGPGQYFYHLPKINMVLNSNNYNKYLAKITVPVYLPDWAYPKFICSVCKTEIKEFVHGGKTYSRVELVQESRKKRGSDICVTCVKNMDKSKINISEKLSS